MSNPHRATSLRVGTYTAPTTRSCRQGPRSRDDGVRRNDWSLTVNAVPSQAHELRRHLRPADRPDAHPRIPSPAHLHCRRCRGLLPRHHQRQSQFKPLKVTGVTRSQRAPPPRVIPPRTAPSASPPSRSRSTPTTLANGGRQQLITNYTGTYSYVIAPDNGQGASHRSARRSARSSTPSQPQATVTAQSASQPQPVRSRAGARVARGLR